MVAYFISGGSPYPEMDGRQILTLLNLGYRMPKPQHVDDKLYETILLFLILFFFSYDAFSREIVFFLY